MTILFTYNVLKKVSKENIKYDIIWNNAGFGADLFLRWFRYKENIPFISTDHGGWRSNSAILTLKMKPDRLIVATSETKKVYEKK